MNSETGWHQQGQHRFKQDGVPELIRQGSGHGTPSLKKPPAIDALWHRKNQFSPGSPTGSINHTSRQVQCPVLVGQHKTTKWSFCDFLIHFALFGHFCFITNKTFYFCEVFFGGDSSCFLLLFLFERERVGKEDLGRIVGGEK